MPPAPASRREYGCRGSCETHGRQPTPAKVDQPRLPVQPIPTPLQVKILLPSHFHYSVKSTRDGVPFILVLVPNHIGSRRQVVGIHWTARSVRNRAIHAATRTKAEAASVVIAHFSSNPPPNEMNIQSLKFAPPQQNFVQSLYIHLYNLFLNNTILH